MSLDLDASRRQTFSTSYLQSRVDELLDGRLTMAPHPSWNLPDEPTWLEDPFSDRNWKFQYHMLRWLEPLLRAARKGDEPAWEEWLRWARSWVEHNLRNRSATPWAWTDMSDGIRALHFCLAAPVVAERTPELLPWLEDVIEEHAAHLVAPENIGNANHALHQHEGLLVVGRVLGKEQYWQLAKERIGALMREQYDHEGVNEEGAIAYHHNNYIWWERTLRRFDVEGIDRPDGSDRHHQAPIEIAHATRPTGTYVTIGDTDPMTPRDLHSPFAAYVASDGEEGEVPTTQTARVYEAGYAFGRSGWGDENRPFSQQTFYSLRFGPSQRTHGHPDGTSVTYTARGVDWIVDPGKFDYSKGAERRYFTSREAHSLVIPEGTAPRLSATTELISGRLAQDHHDLLVEDHSFPRITLRRRLIYSTAGEFLVVIDDASAPRGLRATQRWQLGAGVEASVTGQRVALCHGEEHASITVLSPDVEVSSVRGSEKPLDGWVSNGWKQREPATALQFSATGASLRLVTVIAAGSRTTHASLMDPEHSDAIMALSVETGDCTESLEITELAVRLLH